MTGERRERIQNMAMFQWRYAAYEPVIPNQIYPVRELLEGERLRPFVGEIAHHVKGAGAIKRLEAHFPLTVSELPRTWIQYAWQQGLITYPRDDIQAGIKAVELLKSMVRKPAKLVLSPAIEDRSAEQLALYFPEVSANPKTGLFEFNEHAGTYIPIGEGTIQANINGKSQIVNLKNADLLITRDYLQQKIFEHTNRLYGISPETMYLVLKEFAYKSPQLDRLLKDQTAKDEIMDAFGSELAILVLTNFTPYDEKAVASTETLWNFSKTQNSPETSSSKPTWDELITSLNALGEFSASTELTEICPGYRNLVAELGNWFVFLGAQNVARLLDIQRAKQYLTLAQLNEKYYRLSMEIAGQNVRTGITRLNVAGNQGARIVGHLGRLPFTLLGGLGQGFFGQLKGSKIYISEVDHPSLPEPQQAQVISSRRPIALPGSKK